MNKIFANRFKDKVVVVTGAAQGIGKSVALRAGREGAKVVAVDRSSWLETSLSEAKFHNIELTTVSADLETYAGFTEVFRQTKEKYGRIDVLINNVGGTIWAKPYAEYKKNEIEKEIRRSLFPTLFGCHAVLPFFLEQGEGCIVNVSSIATRGLNRVPYGAAKGGVNAMTVNLAMEYGEHNIRVNAVATGGTEAPPRMVARNTTPQTEQEKMWYKQLINQTVNSTFMKRYGTIQEQVSAILFLASDEASYITGTIVPVGGGDIG